MTLFNFFTIMNMEFFYMKLLMCEIKMIIQVVPLILNIINNLLISLIIAIAKAMNV